MLTKNLHVIRLAKFVDARHEKRLQSGLKDGGYEYPAQYTLFQNGHYFSGLLFAFKLALVASFLNSKYKRILNEATRANLQANKRTLKWQPFWNKKYQVRQFETQCNTLVGADFLFSLRVRNTLPLPPLKVLA